MVTIADKSGCCVINALNTHTRACVENILVIKYVANKIRNYSATSGFWWEKKIKKNRVSFELRAAFQEHQDLFCW